MQYVNVDKYSSMQALIGGLNNEYLILKLCIHEIMSQNGGELMS